ncbi:hypothetical protein [Undibacterium sp. Di24W]|uniref:hypothetical protein n=1 Tax=Undibacterium sp. Di24W TaxID=3413033 RepID=UPI003BF453FE
MRWFELALATVLGAIFTAFHFLPGPWCDPAPVRPLAGIFVVVLTMFYLYLVDDERRPLVGVWHRIGVGSVACVIVAAIASGSCELYALFAFVGALLGLIGFRWLKHVPF